MVNKELLDYINQQVSLGTSMDDIKKILLSNGWLESDVQEAFDMLTVESPPAQPVASIQNPTVINNNFNPSTISNPSTPSTYVSPATPIQAMNPESIYDRPRKNSKVASTIVLIVLLLLILGGGAYAYQKFMYSPERIIQRALANSEDIKSIDYNVQAKMNSTIDDTNSTSTLSMNNAFDFIEEGNPKLKFSFGVDTDALNELTGENTSVNAEALIVNKTIYARLNNFPDFGFFNLDNIVSKWIVIDEGTTKKYINTFRDKEEETKEDNKIELTPEQKIEIKASFEKNKFFTISDKFPDSEVSGVKTYHYAISIDKEKLINYSKEVIDIAGETLISKQESEEGLKALEKIEFSDVDIYIGKKDFLPYRISSKISITDESTGSSTIDLSFTAKSYNEPVSIVAPVDATPLDKFLEENFGFMGAMGNLEEDTIE